MQEVIPVVKSTSKH